MYDEIFRNLLLEKLEKYSDRVFYVINNNFITYGQLLEKAEKLEKYLKNDNSPVMVYGHKNIEMVISFIGCILARRSYIPVDIFTPDERINKIIQISKSTLVINNSGIKKQFPVSSIDDIYSLDNYEYHENQSLNNNEICYIIFTSGSTGIPKGVPISYSNLINFIEWISNIDGLSFEKCNVLNQASFSFDLSVTDFYYSLFNGHTLIGSDRILQENLDFFLDYIGNKRVNVMVITPTFMKYLLLDKKFGTENYPDLKSIYFCGEMLEVEVVKKIYSRFPKINVINAYGPTEATSAVSSIIITKDMLTKNELPVGNLEQSNNKIIIDKDEIIIQGKSVFSGYLGLVKGGYYKEDNVNCYRTGDLGKIVNNKLYCKGRIDNQVKLNGYRIELEEIEKNINSIHGVYMCCVIAKKNDLGKVKYLKAYVVGDTSKEKIYSILMDKLPSYMIPKFIEKVDALPVNNNGKLDRKKVANL